MPRRRQTIPVATGVLRKGTGQNDIDAALGKSNRFIDYIHLNYDVLLPVVGSGLRRDWTVLVNIAKARNLVDAYGKPPSVTAIARAWKKATEARKASKRWAGKLHFLSPPEASLAHSTHARAPPHVARQKADTHGRGDEHTEIKTIGAIARAEARRQKREAY